MGTDQVKPSFVIFDILALGRTLTLSPNCTHMATVSVKGLILAGTSSRRSWLVPKWMTLTFL